MTPPSLWFRGLELHSITFDTPEPSTWIVLNKIVINAILLTSADPPSVSSHNQSHKKPYISHNDHPTQVEVALCDYLELLGDQDP